MTPYALGVVISLVVYVVIGNYAGRKVRHLDDYFVAGRQAPTLLVVGTLVASFLSTNAFLGETGFAYAGYGALILILTAVNSIGYVVGALFFGRYLRRSRTLTVAEYFGRRFNDHRIQVAAGLTIIIGLTAYLLAVTQGASLILAEVMHIPYGAALLITWLGYTAFTLYAGSRGVVITDTLMFLLFTTVTFLALPYIIEAAGGWSASIHSLAVYADKPDIIAWHGMTGSDARWINPTESLVWALILGLSWGLVVAVSPWQSSRYLMARDEHTVVRAGCIAAAAILFLYLGLMSSGALINLSNPNIEPTDKAMIWAALNLMPVLPGVLLMAGLMAAALSSASTFLSLVAFSVSNDIFRRQTQGNARLLQQSRLVMLAVGLLTLMLAWFRPPAIMWITYFAGTLFAASWGPVAFMSVWSKTITAAGAFGGIVAGFLGNAVAKLLVSVDVIVLPVYLDPFVLGLLLSIATILVVSRLTTVSATEDAYRRQLHSLDPNERDPVQAAGTLHCARLLMFAGVVLTAIMIWFYVLPYSSALQIEEDGTSTLFGGELLLAIGYGTALIISGALAWHQIRKS